MKTSIPTPAKSVEKFSTLHYTTLHYKHTLVKKQRMLKHLICRSKRWWQVVFVFLSSFFYQLQAQFQAGPDAGHPFTILVNTDSVYYQNQMHGWFKFNTSNFNNITGNAVTLKGALLPTSSKIIMYDTVFVKSLIIYDSLMNIVFADTIKHIQDTLKITVTLEKIKITG